MRFARLQKATPKTIDNTKNFRPRNQGLELSNSTEEPMLHSATWSEHRHVCMAAWRHKNELRYQTLTESAWWVAYHRYGSHRKYIYKIKVSKETIILWVASQFSIRSRFLVNHFYDLGFLWSQASTHQASSGGKSLNGLTIRLQCTFSEPSRELTTSIDIYWGLCFRTMSQN